MRPVVSRQLNDGAAVDEKTGQRFGFRQVAAAVGAQVHDEHVHAVLVQLADQRWTSRVVLRKSFAPARLAS